MKTPKRAAVILAALGAAVWGVMPPSERDLAPYRAPTVAAGMGESPGRLYEKEAEKVLQTDLEDECGISYLWALRVDHPFRQCCSAHDAEYQLPNARPRLAVDLSFYSCMVDVAKQDKTLRFKAATLYRVVRALGWVWYEGRR